MSDTPTTDAFVSLRRKHKWPVGAATLLRRFERALRLVTGTPQFYDMPDSVQQAVRNAIGKEGG